MNSETEKNLKELFEKFLGNEEAEKAVDDVRRGEQILQENPAPEPDGKLRANIKTEITASLQLKRKNTFRKTIYKTAAVAAGIILFIAVGIELFEKDSGQVARPTTVSVMPKAVWESGSLADDNEELATLIAEIEQIESDLLAMQVGENGGNGYEAVTELEMELIDINNDFWKG